MQQTREERNVNILHIKKNKKRLKNKSKNMVRVTTSSLVKN